MGDDWRGSIRFDGGPVSAGALRLAAFPLGARAGRVLARAGRRTGGKGQRRVGLLPYPTTYETVALSESTRPPMVRAVAREMDDSPAAGPPSARGSSVPEAAGQPHEKAASSSSALPRRLNLAGHADAGLGPGNARRLAAWAPRLARPAAPAAEGDLAGRPESRDARRRVDEACGPAPAARGAGIRGHHRTWRNRLAKALAGASPELRGDRTRQRWHFDSRTRAPQGAASVVAGIRAFHAGGVVVASPRLAGGAAGAGDSGGGV